MAKIRFENGMTVEFQGTPTPQDIEEVARKIGVTNSGSASQPTEKKGLLRKVGDFFTSNTQKFGQSIGQAFGANSADAQRLRDSNVGLSNMQAQVGATIADKKARGEDTSMLEQSLAGSRGVSQQTSQENVFPVLQKTNSQILGEAGGTALEALSGGAISGVRGIGARAVAPVTGSIPSRTAKIIGQSLPFGYGLDVSQNLQEGETGPEAFAPGLGTAFSAVIPGGIGVAQGASKFLRGSAPSVINSLIKPLAKEYRYGKNPGRAVSEMGIKANTWDELATGISQAKEESLMSLRSVGRAMPENFRIDATDTLAPIDEALSRAARNNNDALFTRLKEVKTALTENLVRSSTLTPDEVIAYGLADDLKGAQKIIKDDAIISLGPKQLDGMSWDDLVSQKSTIGDVTRWTADRSNDNLVNAALKQVYYKTKMSMVSAARSIDEKMGDDLLQLNERVADLISAENAVKYRELMSQNKNIISMPVKVGTIGGLMTAAATGGLSLTVALAAVSIGLMEKAMSSVAFKTRLAAWLAKESPGVITNTFQQNPAIRNVIYSSVAKSDSKTDEEIRKRMDSILGKQQSTGTDEYLKSLGL